MPSGLAFFKQELRVSASIRQLTESAGVSVNFLSILSFRGTQEIHRGLEVIVVIERYFAEVNGALQRQTRDLVLVGDRAPLRGHASAFLPRAWLMGTCVVGDHENMLAIGMLEEIKDALLFEQSGHEVEVALLILNAILPRFVRLRAANLEIGIGQSVEDLLRDIEHAHALEDLAVT